MLYRIVDTGLGGAVVRNVPYYFCPNVDECGNAKPVDPEYYRRHYLHCWSTGQREITYGDLKMGMEMIHVRKGLTEAPMKKGGVNDPPTTERPDPPAAQGTSKVTTSDHVKIHIGRTPYDRENYVEINGQRLKRVKSVDARAAVGEVTQVTITLYIDGLDIEGDVGLLKMNEVKCNESVRTSEVNDQSEPIAFRVYGGVGDTLTYLGEVTRDNPLVVRGVGTLEFDDLKKGMNR